MTDPGAFADPEAAEGLRAVRHPGDRRTALRHLRQAGRERRGRRRRAPGNGFVDVYTHDGKLLDAARSQRGALNSPWGMALAPKGFGAFGGDLLVGNFGDGRINAFNPKTGQFARPARDRRRQAARRSTACGRSSSATARDRQRPNTLLFTAGPDGEAHGLFGELTASTP